MRGARVTIRESGLSPSRATTQAETKGNPRELHRMTDSTSILDAVRELYQKKDGSDQEYRKEERVLTEVLTKLSEKLTGSYQLEKPIGRGGSGVVFLVRDLRLNTHRALKIPRPGKGELIDSVQNEIDHLKSLHHDNLIKIYDVGELSVSS